MEFTVPNLSFLIFLRGAMSKSKKKWDIEDPEYWKELIQRPLAKDKNFWTKPISVHLMIDPISLMALHGFMCLALRHPKTKDHTCRPQMIQLVKNLGQRLVGIGALTQEELEVIEKIEAEEG